MLLREGKRLLVIFIENIVDKTTQVGMLNVKKKYEINSKYTVKNIKI